MVLGRENVGRGREGTTRDERDQGRRLRRRESGRGGGGEGRGREREEGGGGRGESVPGKEEDGLDWDRSKGDREERIGSEKRE